MVINAKTVVHAATNRAEGRAMIHQTESNCFVDHQPEVTHQLQDMAVLDAQTKHDNFPGSQCTLHDDMPLEVRTGRWMNILRWECGEQR